MAKNREHENVDSDSDSDSSSDNHSSGSESDSSDSEPELKQTQTTKKKPSSSSTPAAAKKPVQQPASKPSPASGSESDSESNPKDSLSPTPQNGSRKSRTKPAAADPVTPTRSAAQKRPADEEAKPAKKAKKKAGPSDTPKKPLFQRFWVADDELVILQGMKNYWDQKKSDPAADYDAFHNFIKEDLNTKDSITSQLENKMKRLKKKYLNNKKKEEKMKKDGKEMTFSKPLERAAYELSKSVWGTVVAKEANKRTDKGGAAAKEDKAVAAEIEMAYRVKTMGATVDEMVFSIGVELFENGKGDAAGVMEWKKLRLEEMQANLRVLEVKTALSRLVVDRFKSELS